MKKLEQYVPYWIIVSPSRNTICKKPYLTFAEAKREYDQQMRNVAPGVKVDWIIEERYRRVDDTKDGILAEERFARF